MTAKAAKAITKKAKTTKPKAAEVTKTKVVTKPKTAETGSLSAGLRGWNLKLGLVLLAEAIAIIIIGTSRTVEITMQYLAKDALAAEVSGNVQFAAASRHVVDLRLSWVVAGFLAVFALTMILSATVWRKHYENWLFRGVNRLRWVGLGVGGGLIFTTVAKLSGVTDAGTLTLIFGSVVLAGLLAAAVEFVGADRRLRRFLGWGAILAVFLPWLVFARNGAGAAMYGGSLPLYLYFLYASVTLLVVAAGRALYLRVNQRGKWNSASYTEKMFMRLSFAAATIVALEIFAGALQP
jgi:hypothetical protein